MIENFIVCIDLLCVLVNIIFGGGGGQVSIEHWLWRADSFKVDSRVISFVVAFSASARALNTKKCYFFHIIYRVSVIYKHL